MIFFKNRTVFEGENQWWTPSFVFYTSFYSIGPTFWWKLQLLLKRRKRTGRVHWKTKRALLAVLRWCQVLITPPPRSVHWSITEAKFVHKNVIGLTQRHCTHTAALAPSLYSPVFGGRELSNRQQYIANGSSLYPSKTKASANRLTGYASRLTSGRNLQRVLDLPSLR